MSTNSFWVSIGDLEWLVTWLADELETGGVPVASAVAGVGDLGQNSSVPGVHIRWDFRGAWEAAILEGSEQGQVVKSYVDKLTPEKWDKADALHKYGSTFQNATREQRKIATLHYLELHMLHVTGTKVTSLFSGVPWRSPLFRQGEYVIRMQAPQLRLQG